MTLAEERLNELLTRVNENVFPRGAELGAATAESQADLLHWIMYYRASASSDCAQELLLGVRASLAEATAYISLGLVRAAIFSIRTQIDLMLGYTYFRDHPVEWQRVVRTGEGFMQRSDVVKYHTATDAQMPGRLKLLERHNGYSLDQIYRTLSAHVHSQSNLTTPRFVSVVDVATTGDEIRESVVEMQRRSARALSSYLMALNAPNWAELPKALVDAFVGALEPRDRRRFFA